MRLQSTYRFILPIIFLVAFAVLSKYEDRSFIRNLDFSASVKVQDFIGRFCTTRCDGLFEDIGFFASPLFSIVAITVLMFLNRKRKILVLLIPLFFGLLIFGEIYGKTIVGHPAPPFFMLKNPTTIFPKYYVNELFSYPSGHAARAIFLALVFFLSMRKKLWVSIGLGLYVLLVSLSRIYLGHHWLSDVVGGLLLGGGISFLTMSIFYRLDPT